MAVKDPRKLARRVFREYGAVVQEHNDHGSPVYLFPDGMRITVPSNALMGWVAAKCRDVEARYGKKAGTQFGLLSTRPGKPHLDLERIIASAHAKQRLSTMRTQANITFGEVLMALRIPERVLWSPSHGSWLWVRGRLAVAIAEDGDTFVITTVLWSSTELFEQHPRPKESA